MAILSRFTIAANFWKGVVEQVLGLLHHVSKVQRPLMHIWRAGNNWNRRTSCVSIFIWERFGSLHDWWNVLFVFRGPNTTISEKVSCRHVRLTSWTLFQHMNPKMRFVCEILILLIVTVLAQVFARSLGRIVQNWILLLSLEKLKFGLAALQQLQHWTFLRRLVCQPNIF